MEKTNLVYCYSSSFVIGKDKYAHVYKDGGKYLAVLPNGNVKDVTAHHDNGWLETE